MNKNKEKIAVIREGLVKLTGHYIAALILNQFIYWEERVEDAAAFLEEENKRAESDDQIVRSESLEHGWFYKSAKELKEELMLDSSENFILKYVKKLVDMGFVEKRHNPKYKWDRTWQYRVNIKKVATELIKLGYTLPEYKIDPSHVGENAFSRDENQFAQNENQNAQNEMQYQRLHSEITSDIKKIANQDLPSSKEKNKKESSVKREED